MRRPALAQAACVTLLLAGSHGSAAWPSRFAVELIELHGPQGQRLYVNPAEVTSVREPAPANVDRRPFAPGTKCIVFLADGSFLGVRDACDEVRARLTGSPP